jgi:hypothetical protein
LETEIALALAIVPPFWFCQDDNKNVVASSMVYKKWLKVAA